MSDDFNKKMEGVSDSLKDLNQTPDTTAAYDRQDIEANKSKALLSYVGILWLIPMLTAKDSPFVKFHLNQGLTVLILDAILFFLIMLLGRIPLVGGIITVLAYVIIGVFSILGILNCVGGKAKELPIIGGIKLLS